MEKEQILAMIKALKDYNIFDKKEQNDEIAEILTLYIRCAKCPIIEECYADISAKPDYVKFCHDMFLKMVEGVK